MNTQANEGFGKEIDSFAAAIATLPPLPLSIQYEDEFSETIRTIKSNASLEQAIIWTLGSSVTLRFEKFDARIREIVRTFLLSSLIDYAPGTVQIFYRRLLLVAAKTIEEVALAEPRSLQRRWAIVVIDLAGETQISLKRFISFLCSCNFGAWKPHHQDFVSHLPTPSRDQYSVVRAGDCFLEIEEEAQLVRWLDRTASSAATLDLEALRVASLVLCSYQFGMRPIQLGLLRKRDCTIRLTADDGTPTAYLTFRLAKQRNAMASRLPLLRKVKHEWAPLVANLYNALKNESADSFFFGFTRCQALRYALIEKLNEILPGQGRVAYDLRHSLAQRMVDAGASQEELAFALGHTHLRTGLVYFRASANQAELVNKALGLSETYTTVAKIADRRFISTDDLARLKGEQQIGGVPHGLPIAGIGGCTTGQPACPYNPITSCYGCPKFMPVRDVSLHKQVLREFRSVVTLYKDAGAGEQESPAYLQLRRSIVEVQGVINQIEAEFV